MELPAVRPPRLAWHRRFLTQIFDHRSANPSLNRRFPTDFPMATHCGCFQPEPLGHSHSHSHNIHNHKHSCATSITSSAPSHSPAASAPHDQSCGKPTMHKPTLPHTITERTGGSNLWVTAPVLADDLEKQGFRWRKKYKTRFIELNGRCLSYYKITSHTGHDRTPRQSVHLTANAHIVDIDARTFSLTPNPGEKPWVLRARDAATKRVWCKALNDCIDILIWLQHYELGDVLGVGGMGVVRKLTDVRSKKTYAVKIVDAAKFKNRAAIVSEVEILRNITNNIQHPNLVTIHKVYEEQHKIYLILDLCEGGELYDTIVERGCYSERDAARIMAQLMGAVDALHQHNILHLDLKPENILLSSKNPEEAKIILTDFGLARMIHGTANPLDAGTTMAGTIGYIAPEVIAAHQYTEAADVFSAGVILFILLVGYPPFHGDSEVEILLKIARGDFQFHTEHWAHISTPAKELVAQMLAVRAPDRIKVQDVLVHPWIQLHSLHNTSEAADSNSEVPDLRETVQRIKQFNFQRKSESMASCMATMLSEASERDYMALANHDAIETLIRQLSPTGSDRLALDKALVLCRHLCVSPFVNVQAFVHFLDRNGDGFIDAHDFCDGVRAMREGDPAFGKIIFAALRAMVGKDTDADSDGNASENVVLTLEDFSVAFEKLQCPESLSDDFLKYVRTHPDETSDSTGVIDEAAFLRLLRTFRFLAALFVLKAKNNMVRITKSASTDSLAQITEELRGAFVLEDSNDSP